MMDFHCECAWLETAGDCWSLRPPKVSALSASRAWFPSWDVPLSHYVSESMLSDHLFFIVCLCPSHLLRTCSLIFPRYVNQFSPNTFQTFLRCIPRSGLFLSWPPFTSGPIARIAMPKTLSRRKTTRVAVSYAYHSLRNGFHLTALTR